MSGHHYVAHDAKGYHAWRIVNGRYHLDVGPHFPTPRAAMAYADSLDAVSDISPVRARSTEPPIAGPVSPFGAGSERAAQLTARDKPVNPRRHYEAGE